MAIEANGSKFFWSASTSQSTAQQVGEVIDFGGLGGGAAAIDITDLGATSHRRLPGLPDDGPLTLSLNYNATDTGHLALIADRSARVRRAALIKFHDSDTHAAAFKGYCTDYVVTGALDDKVSANVSILIDNGLTYTTA